MKLGAGMTPGDANLIAGKAGYRVVGGECATVGITGGYSQGGGHSILNTAYGMGADQVVEWELITPMGHHLVATPTQNTDLYWALSGGGGGGTYGVVLSMIIKIHPDGPIAGGGLAFANNDNETYWKAISLWLQQTPAALPTLPGQSAAAVSELLAPYIADLKRLNITYQLNVTTSNTYNEHYSKYFGPLPNGDEPTNLIFMNRLVPKAVLETAQAADKVADAFRTTVSSGDFLIGCINIDVANASHADNAVLPAWRTTSLVCASVGFWNYSALLASNLALKKDLADIHTPTIEAATSGGAVYLNEVDPYYRGDWKQELFGANYNRLLAIKHHYDPSHLLWGTFTVASDELDFDPSGRLCSA